MICNKNKKTNLLKSINLTIFKKEYYECRFKDTKHPPLVLTFLSIESSTELFVVLGRLPDYFEECEKVDIEYFKKYSNGIVKNVIIKIYHKRRNIYYNTLKSCTPSIDTLREKYQQIEWNYDNIIIPFWIICNEKVSTFSRKNIKTINGVEFYLNRYK